MKPSARRFNWLESHQWYKSPWYNCPGLAPRLNVVRLERENGSYPHTGYYAEHDPDLACCWNKALRDWVESQLGGLGGEDESLVRVQL